MRSAILIAPFAAALAFPTMAQAPASSPLEGITATQARSMPQSELAERAFRQVAGQMQMMTRPYMGRGYENEPPLELIFATAPLPAGDFGQCMATVVHIGQLRAPDERGLMNEGTIATEIVYKVVGDVDLEAPWTDDYAAHLAQLCREAGPVILADENDQSQPTFFHFSGGRIPKIALIALQRAIRGARAGSYGDVACDRLAAEEAAEACGDPRALLARFDLANLLRVDISRPGQRETQYRVEADLRTSPRDMWRLSLDMDFSVVDMERDLRLRHNEISRIVTFDVSDVPDPPPLPPNSSRRP